MLIEVNPKIYKHYFPVDPHPFISEPFIELYKSKVDRVVWLMEDREKVYLGLVAGIKDGVLLSPFSAPFGGFHFRHELLYFGEIDRFLSQLQIYVVGQGLKKVGIILPPALYHLSFNAKMVNALLRSGFSMETPEITNWIDLHQFTGVFTFFASRKQFNQAIRHELSFHVVSGQTEKENAYQIIRQNRERFGRAIYMTFTDLLNINKLWPVDFFCVNDREGNMVASAICYRGHPKIIQSIFWADSEEGRPIRAMDFCALNLWNHYKSLGYDAIDIGRSSISGMPDEGLVRFKESLDCTSSLRFTFSWSPE